MPGRNVGSIELKVGLDGAGILEEARAEGEAAGEEFSAGFNDRTTRGFTGIGKRVSNQIKSEQAQMEGGGQLGADYVGNAFTARLSGLFDSASRDLANSFLKKTDLDKFAANFENADAAAAHLRGELGFLYDEGKLSEAAFNSYGGTLNQWLGTARKAEQATKDLNLAHFNLRSDLQAGVANFERVREAFDKVAVSAEKAGEKVDTAGKQTKGAGQAVAFTPGIFALVAVAIGAIVSGASNIAVLAEGAAAGLLILADAAGAVLVAGGLLVLAFTGLNAQLTTVAQQQTLAAIPTNQLTKAQAAQLDTLNQTIAGYGAYVGVVGNLKSALSDLRDQVTSTLFTAASPGLDAVTNTLLPKIQTALLGYAQLVGDALGTILSSLASPAGTSGINSLLATAGPLIQNLTSAAISLGGTLGKLFIDAAPFVQSFALGLSLMLSNFDKLIGANPDKVKQFFVDGSLIVGKFGDLLGGAVKGIVNLITPQTVKNTADFLQNLKDSGPFFAELLGGLGQLDAFGLVAQLLATVGDSLVPIFQLLNPILQIINFLVSTSLPAIGVLFQILGLLLSPLTFIFQALADVFNKLRPYIDAVYGAMSKIIEIFQQVVDKIGSAVLGALEQLAAKMVGGVPSAATLTKFYDEKVIPVIQAFADTIVKTVIPAILAIIKHISDFIQSMGGFDGIGKKLQVAGAFFETFGRAVSAAINPIGAELHGINDLIDIINGKYVHQPAESGDVNHSTGKSHAAGGIIRSQQMIDSYNTAGEAGDEAIVPLQRALDQVDPSVRALAAYAQGKAYNPGGPNGSSGNQTVIQQGAIQIVAPITSPTIAARLVLDGITGAVSDS